VRVTLQFTQMHTLAVVNMKGGVAKTTTAIHLAAGFAALGGRVLLVDTDPQGTVANTLRTRASRTLSDVLLGGDAASAVIHDVRPNLDVMAATPTAFALETQLAGAMQRETILSRALRPIAGSYDFIVLDTSPAMSLLTYNALLAATGVIMPIGMEPMAIIGARQTLDGIEQIQSLWPDHPIALTAVVPTAVNANTHASRATMEALEQDPRFGPALFRAGIRQCLDLTYATAQGQTIWEYAPRSRAADDYTALVEHVRAALNGKDTAADAEVAEEAHEAAIDAR
jgi:chromosome partitioning protein